MKSDYKTNIIFIYVFISLSSLIFGSYYINQYYGPLFKDPLFIIVNLIGSLFIIVLIEFGVIYLFLRYADVIIRDLFFSILIVNFSIFLPIQVIAFLLLGFYISFYPFFVLGIFIIVLYLKWLFYRFEFHKLLEKESLSKELSYKKILLISVSANLASAILAYIYPGILILLEIAKWPDIYL